LQVDQIIQRARDVAAINEFNSESFREGLEIIVGDINRSRGLPDAGRAALEQIYVTQLVTRLKTDDWLRRNPQHLDVPIEKPVFVMGMPRTGTTLASYLLDADPARRSLLKWEVWNGIPPATTETLRTDPRCLAMKENDERAANPEAAARHHEDADGPSECTFIVSQDFRSLFLEALHPVPSYRDWLYQTDMTSAYRVHKRMLQMLQSSAPGTWNLKMPSHALFVEQLLKTYPDAKIIWTHRDPYKTMGSLVSLIHGTHMRFGATDTLPYIADHYPRQIGEHARRMMTAEDKGLLHPGNCYHLFYNKGLADPIGEMRKIYAWLGDDFTPNIEARMRAWLRAKPQGFFGKHRYALAEQGLSVDRLKPYFADYLARYPIELEGAA
jgi:Sulfotransferase family